MYKMTVTVKNWSNGSAQAEIIKKNKTTCKIKLLTDWGVYSAGEILIIKNSEVQK
jgi:uncharacterized protein YaiE (UPF0345 family)